MLSENVDFNRKKKIPSDYSTGAAMKSTSQNTYLHMFWLVSFLLKTEADSLAGVMCKVLKTN